MQNNEESRKNAEEVQAEEIILLLIEIEIFQIEDFQDEETAGQIIQICKV